MQDKESENMGGKFSNKNIYRADVKELRNVVREVKSKGRDIKKIKGNKRGNEEDKRIVKAERREMGKRYGRNKGEIKEITEEEKQSVNMKVVKKRKKKRMKRR